MTKRTALTMGVIWIVILGLIGIGAVWYIKYHDAHEYRAEFLELVVPTSAKTGSSLECRVAIENTGTQPWVQGQRYFALGVFDQSKGAGRFKLRVGNPADDAIGDRAIIHTDVYPDMVWAPSFELVLPAEPGEYRVHFQMVQEGATWFGEMKEVVVCVE